MWAVSPTPTVGLIARLAYETGIKADLSVSDTQAAAS